MNIWHDIAPDKIKEDEFLCVIEISRGSKNKYEICKDTGMLRLDRVLSTSTRYPCNYGFIPRTLSEDGDPLDVMVLGYEEVLPMSLVKCAPIGFIEMIDNGERDEKIIAVPIYKGSQWIQYKDISEVPTPIANEIMHFLKVYKDLEKDNKVEIRPLKGREEAIKIIKEALELYKSSF